jgi:hypothetical protein
MKASKEFSRQRYVAQPHHRHQRSLESVIDFSATSTASTVSTASTMSERDRATLTFDQIIDYCSVHEPADAKRKYGRAKLVRLVYDYAPSDAGRYNILKYFLSR